MATERISDDAVIMYSDVEKYYYVSGDDASFQSPDFDNREDAIAWYEHMKKFVPSSVENSIIYGIKQTLSSMFVPGIVWRGSYYARIKNIKEHDATYIKACQNIARETLKTMPGIISHTTPLIEEYLDILRGVVEFSGDNLEDFLNFVQYAIEEVEKE